MTKTNEFWTLCSFRYYDNYCSIVNQGGHKNPNKVKAYYESRTDYHTSCKVPYSGTWHVHMNGESVLTTIHYAVALKTYEELKSKCIMLKEGNSGNYAVDQFVNSL